MRETRNNAESVWKGERSGKSGKGQTIHLVEEKK